jgi:hypothetical protein
MTKLKLNRSAQFAATYDAVGGEIVMLLVMSP